MQFAHSDGSMRNKRRQTKVYNIEAAVKRLIILAIARARRATSGNALRPSVATGEYIHLKLTQATLLKLV